MASWDELVERYYQLDADVDLSAEQRNALSLVYLAAKTVSLEAYQGGYSAFGGQIGFLGELVYTAAVGVPYSLYRAAWSYPFDYCLAFGLDFREDWPDEPIAPDIRSWLPQFLPTRDWEPWINLFDQLVPDEEDETDEEEDQGVDEEVINSVLQQAEDLLTVSLESAIQQLRSVIDELSDRVQEEVTELINLLDRVRSALDPMASQFVDSSQGEPRIPIKRPPGSGILTVLPDPAQADTAVNLQELDIYANVFDLIAVSTHLLAAYLGADRLPRPYYPAVGSSGGSAEWQLNNLADLVGQLHNEFREANLVDTQVRKSVDDDQVETVKTNLGTAVGLVLAALRDLGFDSERNLALSAQAAQASLAALAGIGVKTQTEPLSLGFRGRVPVPVSTGASLAQQLQVLETICSSIALQLGVSLKPQGGG